MGHPKTGQYSIVRTGWHCNKCGRMTFTDKITHHCGYAPHFLSEEVVAIVPKKEIKKVLVLLTRSLR